MVGLPPLEDLYVGDMEHFLKAAEVTILSSVYLMGAMLSSCGSFCCEEGMCRLLAIYIGTSQALQKLLMEDRCSSLSAPAHACRVSAGSFLCHSSIQGRPCSHPTDAANPLKETTFPTWAGTCFVRSGWNEILACLES